MEKAQMNRLASLMTQHTTVNVLGFFVCLLFFFFFWPCRVGCGILVPRLGI